MEPFIRPDQYNFIENQVQNIASGYATVKDEGVLNAVKSLATERVLDVITNLTSEQQHLLQQVEKVDDKEKAEGFLAQLKPYVIPFQITEQAIHKLFPKVKKLKVPPLETIDWQSISYLSWVDPGSNKRFMVLRKDNKLKGIQGSFKPAIQEGICTICNSHEEVGLFLAKEKGKVQGTYTKRGNYICVDSQTCNNNMKSLDKLHEFVERIKG
ncbi:FBP C-terminal treble-clef zinc-finger [Oceanobacillus limi]|uniref:FBP C-terminal treble-clef zinc-finger n=1 Tax=Oceanobacillus limi TaxID=930131 RepID=A0A1I0ENC2_9BACI|nr:FusB/FusC family EF-G-binding protein [Oceanobacillus limi]SET46757.1 FBP C-terminal treble-clef zinc-finger [Oceanobacillus limi]